MNLKALLALVRVRHTAQVVGIVSVLSIKNNGFSVQSGFTIASFFFLCVALFSFDDVHDATGDLVVHPNRPIPKGEFTSKQVTLIGATSFSLGMFFALIFPFYKFILFLILAALGFSVIFLKLGSILRAFMTSSMFFLLFPMELSVSLKSIIFGLIVGLPHFAGSITKDFIHSKGDETIGLEPPRDWTRYVASLTFFTSGGLTLLPILLNQVSWLYAPFILPTLGSCFILGDKILRRQYQKVYLYGGIAMLAALAALATNI